MVCIVYLSHPSARSAAIIIERPVASSRLEGRRPVPMTIDRKIRYKRTRPSNPKEMLTDPKVVLPYGDPEIHSA